MPIIRAEDYADSLDYSGGVSGSNLPTAKPNVGAPIDPTFGETVSAAFQKENVIGSAIADEQLFNKNYNEVDPNFNPLDVLPEEYYSQIEDFAYANSEKEVFDIIKKKEREQYNAEVLSNSGATGIAAGMAAGILDPTVLIPIAGSTAKGGKLLYNIITNTGKGALSGMGAMAAQEALLHTTQDERTLEETVINTIAGGAIGGLIGGVGGKLATKQFLAKEATQELASILKGPRGARSASAAETTSAKLQDEAIVSHVSGANVEALKGMGNRGMESENYILRSLTDNALESHIYNTNAEKNIGTTATETLIDMDNALTREVMSGYKKYYIQANEIDPSARFAEARTHVLGKVKYDQFGEAVQQVITSGIKSGNVNVDGAAALLQKQYNDYLTKIEKAFPEFSSEVKSYFPRVYDHTAIYNNKDGFRDTIADYFSKYDGNKKLREVPLDILEARALADDVLSHILKLEPGESTVSGLADAMAKGEVGHMKERTLNVPDSLLAPWLVKDPMYVYGRYAAQMNRVLRVQEMMNNMGYKSIKELKEDMASKNAEIFNSKTTPKDLEQAKKKADREMKLVDTMFDVLLGAPGRKSSINGFARRLKQYQTLRLMGGILVGSIPDVANQISIFGPARVFFDGLVPTVKAFNDVKLSKDQLKVFNIGLEAENDMVLRMATDPLEDIKTTQYMPEEWISKLNLPRRVLARAGKFAGKTVDAAVSAFPHVTLQGHWQDTHKRFAGFVTASTMLKGAVDPSTLSKADLKKLAQLGISEGDLPRVKELFDKYGEIRNGVYIGNYHLWKGDPMFDKFGAAVLKATKTVIITPGLGDLPEFMFAKGAAGDIAKVAMQLKSFTFAANNAMTIRHIQQRDMASATSVLGSIALGSLVYVTKEKLKGNDVSVETPEQMTSLLLRGFERSGVAGLIAEPIFRGNPYMGDNARYGESNILSLLGGPSASLVQDIYRTNIVKNLIPDVLKPEGIDLSTEKLDHYQIKRLIPYFNLFYLKKVFDEIYNKTTGFEPKQ